MSNIDVEALYQEQARIGDILKGDQPPHGTFARRKIAVVWGAIGSVIHGDARPALCSAFIQRLAEIETMQSCPRVDGEPCPLCGAIDDKIHYGAPARCCTG